MTEHSTSPAPQTQPDQEPWLPTLKRLFRIEGKIWGSGKEGVLIQYRGKLLKPSQDAYDQLAQVVRPYGITPLFHAREGQHLITLKEGVFEEKENKVWVNLILFFFTVLSVIFAGILSSYSGPVTSDLSVVLASARQDLGQAFAFAASLLGILLAHEFGHYFAARKHGTAVTLPYFIPFPLSPLGTMGAFIRLQEPPKNKRVLLDIGIAGPLAGFLVAVPITILGLWLSPVEALPATFPEGFAFEGNSLLYLFLKYVVHGKILPQPASFQGLSPVLYWLQYFFTGTPLPKGGLDVLIHPVAWAGWAGLLVTALNLIPAGQLDGGHLIYVLFGKKAQKLLPVILGILVLLGFVWSGWWLWAFLVFVFGRVHAEPLDQITKLDPTRRALAWLGLLIFLLVFTPIPLLGT